MSAEPASGTVATAEPIALAEESAIEPSAPPSTEIVPTNTRTVEEPDSKAESSEAPPAQTETTAEAPIPAPAVAPPPPEKDVENAVTSPASPQAEPMPAVPAAAPVPTFDPDTLHPQTLPAANAKLFADLPEIIKEADHGEMWGVKLKDASHVPTTIVIEKFLRANSKDVAKAKAQLIEALKWRKEMDPAKLLTETEFDSKKFAGLGYVTVYPKTESHEKEIVTWNIYGVVEDLKETFGNVEEFIKWRAALMELSVQELDLPSATVPIPADGVDPYRMVQVHDYMNISFLRMDPSVKAASKETIQVFSLAYPELLKEKFFVNVPLVMGWVFAAMKLFLAPETVKKFHPLSYGTSLAGECKTFGAELPTAYGGKGKDVKEGLTVMYTSAKDGE